MILQTIFDRVVKHLLTQNCRSLLMPGSSSCRYRGPNGLMCAVGCLINDECYDVELEGKMSGTPEVQAALECSGINVTHNLILRKLLQQLQIIHDTKKDVAFWGIELKNVARDFGLDFNPP